MAEAPVVRVRDVTKSYGEGAAKAQVLRGVSFDIAPGELIALVGQSGSGKSTLLNIIGGLDLPSAGTLRYGELDLSCADDATLTRYRRHHVGFVFQFYNLIPSLTALENVQLVTEISDLPMDAAEALEMVGLGERLNHFPAQLSGGEQQRVAIARAIAKRPDILLCDEPTGALDYQTGKLVLEVLTRINNTLGTTTVVITHNAAIAGLANRVVHIGSGRITHIDVNATQLTPQQISW